MKKILAVASILIAVTPFAFSQTRYNRSSKQGGNIDQMIMQMESKRDRELPAMKGSENVSQCLLTFITESLPDFTLGESANFQIEVCCGTPPYHFEVVQGTLPEGLHLNQHGKITGKPLEVSDTTVFVRVMDRAGCSLTRAFQVRVVEP